MRSLLRLMKPDNFEDISAVIALYRPGPMGANSHINYALRKNGQQQIDADPPRARGAARDILDTTYGLIIYQEQVMAIAQRVAGFSLGQADILRRAMGKKKKSELDKQYEGFSAGMKENGYGATAIKTLWDILVPFSDYAFNKAHSAAYGVLSYWTAYLKAHYPAEYMAALLTSVGDAKDKLAVYLNECRRMGIKVLPPDVNESIGYFAAVGEDIRFGLGAVRNVGFDVVEPIAQAREEKGALHELPRLPRKVPLHAANKRTVESLIKAGRVRLARLDPARAHGDPRGRRRARGRATSATRPTARSASTSTASGTSRSMPSRRSPSGRSGRRGTSSRSSARCSASTSPTTRSPGSRASSPSTPASRSPTCWSARRRTTANRHRRRARHERAAPRARNSRQPVRHHQVEDFGGEITVMFMGKTYQEFAPALSATRSSSCAGGCRCATTA